MRTRLLAPLLGTCLTLFSSHSGADPDKITIKGSDTLGAKLIPRLAELYREEGNNIHFAIAAEGSSSGFAGLLDGSAEIAMASRPIKNKERIAFVEKGMKPPEEHPIALDLITVIVNEKNPVSDLRLSQVRDIFTGRITSWSELGGEEGRIDVYIRNTSSGTRKSFQELAMEKRPYGSNSIKISGAEIPSDPVLHSAQSIGYVGLAFCNLDGIKAVSINGEPATFENRHNYPIRRNLSLYLLPDASDAARRFVEWIQTSPKAIEVTKQVGFLPY